MLIFNENVDPFIIDSISGPFMVDYFWVLDLQLNDYTLIPLIFTEEIITPTMTLKINQFKIEIPTTWNVLIFAEDTMEVDIINVHSLAGKDFTALCYRYDTSSLIPGKITVVDYSSESIIHCPTFSKHQMLCHPIAPKTWVNVSPSDMYNKYLKDKNVYDILGD